MFPLTRKRVSDDPKLPKDTIDEAGVFSCSNKLGDSLSLSLGVTIQSDGGNRDNVPSLRPVTSANDIQIPLRRRDVRLTTFGLQIDSSEQRILPRR